MTPHSKKHRPQKKQGRKTRSIDEILQESHDSYTARTNRKQNEIGSFIEQIEFFKSHIRVKVKNVFHRIKIQFGYAKVYYRGIINASSLQRQTGFTNLLRRRRLITG